MSKRDQGAPLTTYMDGGSVPEAVVNYLCLLGWSPKDNREKLPLAEVVERFRPAADFAAQRAVRPDKLLLAERASMCASWVVNGFHELSARPLSAGMELRRSRRNT